MNRPKRENYKSHIEYDEYGAMEFNGIDDYYEALEKYCDELEYKLDVLKEEYNADQKYIEDFDTTKEWYWKKIKQLEKALDKASKILEEGYGEEYASYIYMKNLDEGIKIPSHMNINEWKEWLMKDE